MRKFASKSLVLIGFIILVVSAFFLWRRNDPSRLQFEGANVSISSSENSIEPVGIAIESLALKLPIVSASKNGDRWETTSNGVSYLSLSPKPGETGNSILYGHNWGSILGNLYKVKPGEKIEVYYSDGTGREFEVLYVQEVTPQDTSILRNSDDKRITLYTCSGLLDQKRLVVTALLI